MAGVMYVRGSGGHVAERVRPAEGSPEATELQALAADPASGWRAIPDTEPEAPAKTNTRKGNA